MEFSRALAKDITYAESDIDGNNTVEQAAKLFVYEKWCDKDVKVNTLRSECSIAAIHQTN